MTTIVRFKSGGVFEYTSKMEWLKISSYSLIFLAGFLSCLLFIMFYGGTEIPYVFAEKGNTDAPGNWIKENQIHVYDNAVVIDINNADISRYAPTGSMKPVLDEYSTGIRIVPKSEEEINVGDIVTFEKDNDLIIHRVIEKGEDSDGVYFITQGDNSNVSDGKIRFNEIKYVTIGVIW